MNNYLKIIFYSFLVISYRRLNFIKKIKTIKQTIKQINNEQTRLSNKIIILFT